jgi:deazaflavin-dependent oxidoreductase (nitroreductase family)
VGLLRLTVTTIADLAHAEYCYLTTRGRRTGRPHRIEIWFVAHEDAAYLLAGGEGDWYRNLVADPAVTLEIGGERRTTLAYTIAANAPINALVRPAMAAKYQPGYGEDLDDWSREALLVEVAWPPEP